MMIIDQDQKEDARMQIEKWFTKEYGMCVAVSTCSSYDAIKKRIQEPSNRYSLDKNMEMILSLSACGQPSLFPNVAKTSVLWPMVERKHCGLHVALSVLPGSIKSGEARIEILNIDLTSGIKWWIVEIEPMSEECV